MPSKYTGCHCNSRYTFLFRFLWLQVEGLTHVNLYVQAHSKVVLILLAEEGLNTDCKAIKALVRLGATLLAKC